MPDLSPRQREMLEFIAISTEANGYQPSYDEIAKHFGWASRAYCSAITRRLAKLGVARNRGMRALSFDWKNYLSTSRQRDAPAARTSRRHRKQPIAL
jgi:SOS-response transcriptional repressor LexA